MPSANEGLPLAILEAMSCGCSVVVTDIRGFGMVENDKTGYKVPVSNPEQLASAIEKAWLEQDRFGIAARQAIEEHYSLDTMADRLLSIIHKAPASK
jgi:glycosyltransferase involved in cell wall biosynthesis